LRLALQKKMGYLQGGIVGSGAHDVESRPLLLERMLVEKLATAGGKIFGVGKNQLNMEQIWVIT